MTDSISGSWLEIVLFNAQVAGWCMRPSCTTCGCLEFRHAYWTGAVQQAGMSARIESPRHPRDLLAAFSSAEREVIVRTLVAGLRQLPPRWCHSEGFRAIIIDLDPPLIQLGVPMVLDTELYDTPAAEGLARMRAHASKLSEERRRNEAFNSPQAVEERKRVDRTRKAAEHALRLSETHWRNTQRLELLANLARLSIAERLSQFALDQTLNLDCVSAELIPGEDNDLNDMEMAKAVILVARIGQRKGAWGRLRRLIENWLQTEV